MEGYAIKSYKSNIQEIIRDAVLVRMHEEGIIQSNEIDKAKMRLELEQSTDDLLEKTAISEDVLTSAKEKGLLSYVLQYAIENNLTLYEEELGTPDPMQYAIEQNIEIDRMKPEQYARKMLEKDFGKACTEAELQAVDDKMKSFREEDSPEALFKQMKEFAVDLSTDRMVNSILNKKDIELLADAKSMQDLASLQTTFEKVEKSIEKQAKHIDKNVESVEKRLKQSKLRTLGGVFKNCTKAAGWAIMAKSSNAKLEFEKVKSGLSILLANKDKKQGILDKIKAQRDKTKTKKKWVEKLKEQSTGKEKSLDATVKPTEI